MNHKISTGVLIFKDNKILLVKHVDPKSSNTWWVPPGGGIENDESLFDAAKREVLEETGLKVKIEKVIYLRQLIYAQQNQNVLTIYMLAKSFSGKLTTKNLNKKDLDSQYIKEIKFFSKDEIKKIKVFPEILGNEMWNDLNKDFHEIKFLGTHTD